MSVCAGVDWRAVVWALAVLLHVSRARICCDQECKKPISYGRTKDRYITQETGYLSFPNAAIVTVLAKLAAVDTSGQEMWLAEIQSRRGLIPAEMVSELHILCEPRHAVQDPIDSGTPPDTPTVHPTHVSHPDSEGNEQPHTGHPGSPPPNPSAHSTGQYDAVELDIPPASTDTHIPDQKQQQQQQHTGDTLEQQQQYQNAGNAHQEQQQQQQQQHHQQQQQQQQRERERQQEMEHSGPDSEGGEGREQLQGVQHNSQSNTQHEQAQPPSIQQPERPQQHAGQAVSRTVPPSPAVTPTLDVPDGTHLPRHSVGGDVPEDVQEWREQQRPREELPPPRDGSPGVPDSHDYNQPEPTPLLVPEYASAGMQDSTEQSSNVMENVASGHPAGGGAAGSEDDEGQPGWPGDGQENWRLQSEPDVNDSEPRHSASMHEERGQSDSSGVTESSAGVEHTHIHIHTEQGRETVDSVDTLVPTPSQDSHTPPPQEHPHQDSHPPPPHEYPHQGSHTPASQEDHHQGSRIPPPQEHSHQGSHTPPPQEHPHQGSYIPPPQEHPHQDSHPPPPQEQPDQDSHTPSPEDQDRQYSQSPPAQDSLEGQPSAVEESPQDPTLMRVILATGQEGRVRLLGDGMAELTLPSGQTSDVDYDYFHGLDIDLPNMYMYDDYDYVPGAGNEEDDDYDDEEDEEREEHRYGVDAELTDDRRATEQVEELEQFASPGDERTAQNMNSDSESRAQTTEHIASLPDVADTTRDQHRPRHDYLNVNSLRQRYQPGRPSGQEESSIPQHDTPGTEAHIFPDGTESGAHATKYALPDEKGESPTPSPETTHEPSPPPLYPDEPPPAYPAESPPPFPDVPPPPSSVESPPTSPTEPPPLASSDVLADDDQDREELAEPTLSVPDTPSKPPPQHQLHDQVPPQSAEWNRDLLIEYLPPSLAAWAVAQGPELGLVGMLATALALLVPLCCSCCHFWRDGRRKASTISKQTASRRVLEEQIKKLKSEKSSVHSDLLHAEERSGSLEQDLEQLQQQNDRLTEAKADLEAHCELVASSLSSVQEELAQCQSQVDTLRSQLSHEQAQLSAQTSEKAVALQQMAVVADQLQQSQQTVQELEAAKEQLEQDAFTTHNSLQQLEQQHTKVSQELDESISKNAELTSDLSTVRDEVCSLQQAVSDHQQEIQTLRDCLRQVTTGTDTSGGGGEEEVDGAGLERSSEEALAKIQAMLETTKVQSKLIAVTEERDQVAAALQEHTVQVEDLKVENSKLCEHQTAVEVQLAECTAQYQRLQDKHKTLTEYFEQKEHSLHRMLGAEEAVRQAVETREAQVKEKAVSLEQTESRHKEELKQLRSEMFEIEKSLMAQVHTCQKRAEEAIAEQRRLEQDCKGLKLEREDLRKRVVEYEEKVQLLRHQPHPAMLQRPPSAGLPSDRPPPHPYRPPSAPYLPRTSSPSAMESSRDQENVASMLNHTDPLPAPLPPSHIPNPGDPNRSLPGTADHQDSRLPPPMRHPPPDREIPRYPPPGRRMVPAVRGYPPMERRYPPPLSRPRAVPPPRGPFPYDHRPLQHPHRDIRDTYAAPERRRPVSNPPGAWSNPPSGVYQPPPPQSNYQPTSSAGFVPVNPGGQPTLPASSHMQNPHSQTGQFPSYGTTQGGPDPVPADNTGNRPEV